jgi:hypothetical protein
MSEGRNWRRQVEMDDARSVREGLGEVENIGTPKDGDPRFEAVELDGVVIGYTRVRDGMGELENEFADLFEHAANKMLEQDGLGHLQYVQTGPVIMPPIEDDAT